MKLYQVAFNEIRRRKIRTAHTASGVVISVALLVASIIVAAAGQKEIMLDVQTKPPVLAAKPGAPKPAGTLGAARRRRSRQRWLWAGLFAAAGAGALYLADHGVARYQAWVIEQKQAERLKLDRMVLHYLRADVSDVVFTGDGRYKVTIHMENVYPEYDMYVLLPQVTTMAQVGPMWREVPTSDPGTSKLRAGTVVKLTERITYDRIFEMPKDKQFFELLPGFFHVKFDNVMLVSPLAEPKDDIAERPDNYFIHLLPVGADLDNIREKHQFPGGKVPIYIPMPPH